MSVNEDLIQPSSDSFWEVDCYKRTVKRQDDGHKLCGDLMTLIQERAEIEKHYAKSLKAWSKKWHELIDKGPEYGTTQGGWKGILTEAERVADLHIQIKEKLIGDVQNEIKQWRGENFHKPMVGPCKETKEVEDGFRKAQKPWAKRLGKVMKSRKEYHTACKLEKTATHQENNARGDSSVSPDQLKKLQDKAEKCRREVESTKERYEAALNDLNAYNAKYMEDMTEVFNKSQVSEEKRLKFFKEMLFGIRKCLDISTSDEYAQIYHQLEATINNADYSKDLKWWSNNHGIDMAMNWPTFEEYSPELQEIVKKKKGAEELPGVALRSINTDRYHKEFVEYSPDMHSISRKDKKSSVQHSGGSDGITLTSIHRNEHPPVSATHSTNSNSNAAPPPAQSAYTNNSYSDGTPSPSPNVNRLSQSLAGSSSDKKPPAPEPKTSTPKKKTPVQKQKSYDQTMNPFADDSDEEEFHEAEESSASSTADNQSKDSVSLKSEKSSSSLSRMDDTSKPSSELALGASSKPTTDYDPRLNPFGEDDHEEEEERPVPRGSAPTPSGTNNGGQSQNPFGDDDWTDYDNPMTEQGVPIRALYDYDGQEEDELSFKVGDVFIKLRDKDDQGWCTGQKDGRLGLYPDNYVEPIGN